MTVDIDLILFNQHSADERTKVFEFASVNIHVVVFDWSGLHDAALPPTP